jgi:hypothetical protein
MTFSFKTKYKVLKKVLSSEINPDTYCISDIAELKQKLKGLSQNEFLKYLKILEWEHLIDIEYDFDNKISTIQIFPVALEHLATHRSETAYKNITLFFAAVSTICTIIQIINLFLQA